MKIYIVSSFDEQFDGEGHSARIMKAFSDESKAHDFMADCGFELEQWEKTIPEEVDNEDFYQTKWDEHCAKHPFSFHDGYMATGFFCQEMDVE